MPILILVLAIAIVLAMAFGYYAIIGYRDYKEKLKLKQMQLNKLDFTKLMMSFDEIYQTLYVDPIRDIEEINNATENISDQNGMIAKYMLMQYISRHNIISHFLGEMMSMSDLVVEMGIKLDLDILNIIYSYQSERYNDFVDYVIEKTEETLPDGKVNVVYISKGEFNKILPKMIELEISNDL